MHRGVVGETLGPVDMGEGRMHGVGEPGHRRDASRLDQRIGGQQPRAGEFLRQVGQDGGVLDQYRAVDA